MPALLFASQVAIETWAEQKKIEFQGNVMTLVAGEGCGRSYALVPAVLFLKVVGGECDPNQLIAKVKTEAKLRELGAEHLETSVVLGDVAYEVQPGFLAEASALQAAASARPEAPPPGKAAAPSAAQGAPAPPPGQGTGARSKPLGSGPLPKDLEEKRKEAEALARFLLDNLS